VVCVLIRACRQCHPVNINSYWNEVINLEEKQLQVEQQTVCNRMEFFILWEILLQSGCLSVAM